MARRRFFTSRELALIIVLSALGGGVSVPLGYASSALNALSFVLFGTPQLLSGVHVLWILLAGDLVPRAGASALTGALKGLVELTFFSQHNMMVLLLSTVEGLVMEAGLLLLGREGAARPTSQVASPPPATSSSSSARGGSFISGAFFAGYLGVRALKIAKSLGLVPSPGIEDCP